MSEALQTQPVIDYIHTVVAGNTNAGEGINAALRQYETFLLSSLRRQHRGVVPKIPILVEHPVFKRVTKPLPELNGDTPAAAIFKTITSEIGGSLMGNIEVFRRKKKNRQRTTPTDIFVLREEDTLPTRKPEKLFRADRQVINGEIYSSVTALKRSGVELGYGRLQILLADLPTAVALSRNRQPVQLYSEKEAEKAIKQWIEKTAEKSAVKESRPQRLDAAVWAPTSHYINIYNVSKSTVGRILSGVGTTMFGGRSFFRRDQADEAFKQYFLKKPVEGMHFRDSEARVTLNYLSNRTGIDGDKLHKEFGSLGGKDDITGYTLYPLVGALAIIDQIKGIPHVASDGIYTDDTRRRWANETVLRDLLGISGTKFAEYKVGAEKIPVRGRRGMPKDSYVSPAYDVAQIGERASSYLSRPTLEAVKREDSQLIIAEDLAAEYGLPARNIHILLSSIGTPLRDDKVKVAYPKTDARAQLDAFTALPQMDRKKRQYVDAERKVYVERTEARRRLHTSETIINEAVDTGEIGHLTARGQTGTFELYSLSDLRKYKKRPRKKRTRSDKVSIAQLEEEGRAIRAQGYPFNTTLRGTHPGFCARVYRSYPGGMAAMRIVVDDTSKKRASDADIKSPETDA